MSIALIAGIVVVILIVLIAARGRGGPRITTIERTTERRDEEDGA